MRLFESILLLILIALIYQLVFSKQKTVRPIHLLLFVLILAVAHLMFEGYRRQMVPAYLSFGIAYLRVKTGGLKFTRQFNKITWSLGTVIAVGLPFAVPIMTLPETIGPFQIGANIYQWADTSRMEWFTTEDENEMARAFNMGIGMVFIVDADDVNYVKGVLSELTAVYELGTVVSGEGVNIV